MALCGTLAHNPESGGGVITYGVLTMPIGRSTARDLSRERRPYQRVNLLIRREQRGQKHERGGRYIQPPEFIEQPFSLTAVRVATAVLAGVVVDVM